MWNCRAPKCWQIDAYLMLSRRQALMPKTILFVQLSQMLGIVEVPDQRISKLENIVSPEKTQPATVELVDIAGLVAGASKGEGLGIQVFS